MYFKEVVKILRNFSWAIVAIPFAQAHYLRLQHFYLDFSKKLQGDLDVVIPLSSEAQIDLEWGMSNLSHVNGRKFSARSPDIVIY